MKPLPEAVQLAFPCALGRLPDRPWWGCCQYHDNVPRYRRNDSVPSEREQLVYIIHPTAEQAVNRDAESPRPHPGYRAGQVWANEHGHSVAILAAALGIVVTSTREWDEGEFARFYPYLMADPACPHLAPWSPAEEVKP